MQGASPLASPGINRSRHWLDLPRGRGPSQTPPSLATDSSISPGPPSPWLPALPTGKHLCQFYTRPQAPPTQGGLYGRFCKCRKRFNAGVPGAEPPAKQTYSPPLPAGKGVGGMGAEKQSKGRGGRRQGRQAPRWAPQRQGRTAARKASPPLGAWFAPCPSAARVQPRGCKGFSPLHKITLSPPLSRRGRGSGGYPSPSGKGGRKAV